MYRWRQSIMEMDEKRSLGKDRSAANRTTGAMAALNEGKPMQYIQVIKIDPVSLSSIAALHK